MQSNAVRDPALIVAEPLSKNPISRKLITSPSGTTRNATSLRAISGANACWSSSRKLVRSPFSSVPESDPEVCGAIRPSAAVRCAFSMACTVLKGIGSRASIGTWVVEAGKTPSF